MQTTPQTTITIEMARNALLATRPELAEVLQVEPDAWLYYSYPKAFGSTAGEDGSEMDEATHSALRFLAARWVDAAFLYDDSDCSKAETLRACASDIARVISKDRKQRLATTTTRSGGKGNRNECN